MKKLLLITTGGTIASTDSSGCGLAPGKRGADMLTWTDSTDTDILDLYAIDSTDVSPAHWRRLYDAVIENLPDYNGIVILHGTDTMAYTGAVLAFTLAAGKPVILTGSMLPFDAPDSDARDNIDFALKTALSGDCRGTALAFAGRVIGGADIVKTSSREKDAFRSYSGYSPDRIFDFPPADRKFPKIIKLSPFTLPEDLSSEDGRPVIVESFGAGGIPVTLRDALGALAKKTRTVITTPCFGGTSLPLYEVGRRALSLGAEELPRLSTPAAAVKIWLDNR